MATYHVQVSLLLGVIEHNLIPKDWCLHKITNCCLRSVRRFAFNSWRIASSIQKSVAIQHIHKRWWRTYVRCQVDNFSIESVRHHILD